MAEVNADYLGRIAALPAARYNLEVVPTFSSKPQVHRTTPMSVEITSSRAGEILMQIAAGKSNVEISASLSCEPSEIFAAATLGAELCAREHAAKSLIAEVRRINPRAYLPWTKAEEQRLQSLVAEQKTIEEIAAALQRQPSAISSRMQHLVAATQKPSPVPRPKERKRSVSRNAKNPDLHGESGIIVSRRRQFIN